MIYEILRDQKEAEDALQEAFIQMWKKAATYDSTRSGVFTWAVMIARHKAIDRLRATNRHQHKMERVGEEFKNNSHAAASNSGLDAAESGDERKRIFAAMAQIPVEQREAIDLAFFSGLTHTDISTRLAVPLGTIKARIRRGMLALQTLLQKR